MIKFIKDMYFKYKEIVNYLIVGGLTTLVDFIVYYGSVFTFLDPENGFQLQVAIVLAWLAAVTFAYFTNRKYVFESKNSNVLGEAIAFFGARVGTLLLSQGIMLLFVTILGMNDKIMKLVVQVVVTVANYIFSKLFVFKKEKPAEISEAEMSSESE